MEEELRKVEFNSFVKLMRIVDPLIDIMNSQEFLEFIDNLDEIMLKKLIKNPKETNRMNFLELMLQRHTRSSIWIIKKILELIGMKYFNYLMDHVVDNDEYINIHILEFLVYIDSKKIRYFLDNTKYRFKYDFGYDIKWDFHLILYVLLFCFNPEELMIYLEREHRKDLINVILPEMSWFRYLKMSSQSNLDMKHFITAFLLEEVDADLYYENLEKLGLFLSDIMLSELSNINNENKVEINLRIIKAIDWLGERVEKKLDALSEQYNIEKLRDLL